MRTITECGCAGRSLAPTGTRWLGAINQPLV